MARSWRRDLKELVRLRNQVARGLGFPSYHALQLHLNEQSQSAVIALFDELDALTREPFLRAKAEIDTRLAKSYGIAPGELRPWHVHDPFFQETPAVFDTDLDAPYKKADILKFCRQFYAGIGLPIEDVIARSDLYEKHGKSPHAFCTDIDREGDVRVLANIVPTEYWMGTMLHELGHSVYSSRNMPRSVPYVLRTEAHILTTEGVAMLFEKFSKDADWLRHGCHAGRPRGLRRGRLNHAAASPPDLLAVVPGDAPVREGTLRRPRARPGCSLVGPGREIPGALPSGGQETPDYASKIHIVSAPCYYHNYMMGQLFASQVHHAIAREVLGGVAPSKANYVGRKDVGAFLKAKVFEPARTMTWNGLTRHATGADLNPKAFAADFQG